MRCASRVIGKLLRVQVRAALKSEAWYPTAECLEWNPHPRSAINLTQRLIYIAVTMVMLQFLRCAGRIIMAAARLNNVRRGGGRHPRLMRERSGTLGDVCEGLVAATVVYTTYCNCLLLECCLGTSSSLLRLGRVYMASIRAEHP